MKKETQHKAKLIHLAKTFCKNWCEQAYGKKSDLFTPFETAQHNELRGHLIVFILENHREIKRISTESR